MKSFLLTVSAVLIISPVTSFAWEAAQAYACQTGETITIKQVGQNDYSLEVAEADDFTTRRYVFSTTQTDPQEAVLRSAVNLNKFDGARARFFGKGKSIVYTSFRGETISCVPSKK